MKHEEGKPIALELTHAADVIIENNRPGVTTRLGLGHGAVRLENPSVIYLSITGFGQTGPMANRPATDAVMQAFSGLMSTNKDPSGMPRRINLLAVEGSLLCVKALKRVWRSCPSFLAALQWFGRHCPPAASRA